MGRSTSLLQLLVLLWMFATQSAIQLTVQNVNGYNIDEALCSDPGSDTADVNFRLFVNGEHFYTSTNNADHSPSWPSLDITTPPMDAGDMLKIEMWDWDPTVFDADDFCGLCETTITGSETYPKTFLCKFQDKPTTYMSLDVTIWCSGVGFCPDICVDLNGSYKCMPTWPNTVTERVLDCPTFSPEQSYCKTGNIVEREGGCGCYTAGSSEWSSCYECVSTYNPPPSEDDAPGREIEVGQISTKSNDLKNKKKLVASIVGSIVTVVIAGCKWLVRKLDSRLYTGERRTS